MPADIIYMPADVIYMPAYLIYMPADLVYMPHPKICKKPLSHNEYYCILMNTEYALMRSMSIAFGGILLIDVAP